MAETRASPTIRQPLAGLPRRGLSRVEAAMYVGISPCKFDQLIVDGRMPGPRRIDGRKVWDLRELDLCFDDLPRDESGARLGMEYIHEYHDRHGKLRRYVRRPGARRVPLPGIPGSPEFMQAYQDAIAGAAPLSRSRHKIGTLGALATDFYKSADFANLSSSSQRSYRAVLDPVVQRDGHRLARDLQPDKARKVIQEIGEQHPGMANLTRAVLRRLFSYAIDLGLRRDNTFE